VFRNVPRSGFSAIFEDRHQPADPIHSLVPLFRQRLLVLKPVPHRVQPLDEVSKFNRARRTVSRATAIAPP
jgi:hypothetical protein